MITEKNKPINNVASDEDFTIGKYRELCLLSVQKYPISDYSNIPWGERFILWRHDMDYSLNRGLVLSKIERAIGIKATYFLNPHSEFYNLAEASQHAIVKEILSLGHDIGLHFDASFFGEISEDQLNDLIAREADYLNWLFDVRPVAFSFHNPVTSTLTFEADSYGGVLNCYSKRFKTEVSYCSDSNGYWRFRRLYDVLSEATDPCLQVLTHPGWWQDKPMPARKRIFRSILGRAAGTLRSYDEALDKQGRLNHFGAAEALSVLKKTQPRPFQLCDYLWNLGEFHTLFVELWRIHEAQINHLCKAELLKEWAVPAHEVNKFFTSCGISVNSWELFSSVFNEPWQNVAGVDIGQYQTWHRIRNQVIHGRSSIEPTELELGCVAICKIIGQLAQWGRGQPIGYDGLGHLGSVAIHTIKSAVGSMHKIFDEVKDDIHVLPEKRWVVLQEKIAYIRAEKLGD